MAESKIVGLLECGICLEQYKKPRGLPCLHCFCNDCLERYCKGQKKVLCPNCKKTTAVPKEGVSGLPAHFIINTLQEMVDKAKETTLSQLEGSSDPPTRVTQTGSDYDITSVFPTLSTSLEEIKEMTELQAAAESLGYVWVTTLDSVGDKWGHSGEFSTKPGLVQPFGIAVNKDGDIAVTNGCSPCQVFSKDGEVKHTFQGPFDADIFGIAVTADNKYILPGNGDILFCDTQGNRLNYPKAHTTDINNKPHNPFFFTVDSKGRIVTGLHDSATISIHHGNGQFISKFDASSSSGDKWLAVTSKGDIVVYSYMSYGDKALRLMDYSGKNVRVVQPPQGVSDWRPVSVCCSKQGEIFVVNNGNFKAVYRYTADGDQCLGCVIKGLASPVGIAISGDGQRIRTQCSEDIPKTMTFSNKNPESNYTVLALL